MQADSDWERGGLWVSPVRLAALLSLWALTTS